MQHDDAAAAAATTGTPVATAGNVAPPAAVEAKTPETVVPVPPRPKWTLHLAARIVLVTVAVVVLALVLPPTMRRAAIWWQTGGVRPPVVYALAQIVPTEPCMPVNIDELRNGTAVYGTIELRNVRASLHHHLRYSGPDGTQQQGIAAQYLERHRICMALVNMIYAPDDAPNLVEMFNMRIIGASTNRRTRNTERSVLCTHPYTARRFQDIVIEYWTATGVRMERDVFGVAAQTIQQIDDVQSGNGYCQDTNLEAQLERLRRRVDAIDHAPVAFALPQLPAQRTP